ncbi:hypothetical protein AA313_de0201788 [Arthrobotrys entomopaga]|nr:hypothetical protein AA313_de0201788 [Arthrobotrys entomopaga]
MSGYFDQHLGPPPPYEDSDEEMYDAPEYDENGPTSIGIRIGGKKKKEALPLPPPPPPAPIKVSKSSKAAEEKACGACREIGHDRRSCPKLLGLIDQQKQEDLIANTVKKIVESMAASTSTKAPKKSKAEGKKESTEPVKPKVTTTKASRGKVVTAQGTQSPQKAKTLGWPETEGSSPAPANKQKKQTARRAKPFNPVAATSDRGKYVPTMEPTWQMEPEEVKAVRPVQTAKRGKPSTLLGARGSKGGGGVSKKASETVAKKKATASTAVSKSVKKNMNSINLTLNLGNIFPN